MSNCINPFVHEFLYTYLIGYQQCFFLISNKKYKTFLLRKNRYHTIRMEKKQRNPLTNASAFGKVGFN